MSKDSRQIKDVSVKEIIVDKKAGFLVLRLRPGEGLMIFECIEIRLTSVGRGEPRQAEIAVRAPKDYLIRRLK